ACNAAIAAVMIANDAEKRRQRELACGSQPAPPDREQTAVASQAVPVVVDRSGRVLQSAAQIRLER
ncbi:MAG: hypothetical protein WBG92_23460, partial [Thiohalocapsa sp.]